MCLSLRGLGEQSGRAQSWGHSAALVLATIASTDVLGFLLVPILQFLEKTCLPPPTCPSCLSMPGQWGRGPAPRSPVLTPSGILGLMSYKMRRLQLTRTGGARTRLLAQRVTSFSRHLAHLPPDALSWRPFLVWSGSEYWPPSFPDSTGGQKWRTRTQTGLEQAVSLLVNDPK